MSSNIITWPAPADEAPSPDYTLQVEGLPVFVYQARVREDILQNDGLWTHQPNCPAERTAFAVFDIGGEVTVVIRPTRPFRTATVLPVRAGIAAEVAEGAIRFTLREPRHLTVILDGRNEQPLHLFIAKPEADAPRPGDPNVIYFGPGLHQIQTLDVASGQTVYLAGGAVVKGTLRPGEQGAYSDRWKVTFFNGLVLGVNKAHGVRICGRGILDGSLIPHPGRNLIGIVDSQDVRVEGIVLRDSPNWNVLIQRSGGVRVDGVRIVSGRLW